LLPVFASQIVEVESVTIDCATVGHNIETHKNSTSTSTTTSGELSKL
jgi:hypothetical protein